MKGQCESCGKKVEEATMRCAEDGTGYCAKCSDEMMLACAVCGKIEYMFEMTGDDNGNAYCIKCATAV